MDKGARIETGKYYYTKKKKASAEVETHLVQPGETLWSISQKYGIKLSSLKAKNRIRKDRDLKAGMVLNLQEHRKRNEEIPIVKVNQSPKPQKTLITSSSSETTPTKENINRASQKVEKVSSTHIVKQGDTLFAISKKYGISINELKNWNNIGSDNLISIGQKLVIFAP